MSKQAGKITHGAFSRSHALSGLVLLPPHLSILTDLHRIEDEGDGGEVTGQEDLLDQEQLLGRLVTAAKGG